MSDDDLTRRAIIAAHDAHCARGTCGDDVSTYPKLSKSEQAIVEAWRADREAIAAAIENEKANTLDAQRVVTNAAAIARRGGTP